MRYIIQFIAIALLMIGCSGDTTNIFVSPPGQDTDVEDVADTTEDTFEVSEDVTSDVPDELDDNVISPLRCYRDCCDQGMVETCDYEERTEICGACLVACNAQEYVSLIPTEPSHTNIPLCNEPDYFAYLDCRVMDTLECLSHCDYSDFEEHSFYFACREECFEHEPLRHRWSVISGSIECAQDCLSEPDGSGDASRWENEEQCSEECGIDVNFIHDCIAE